MRKMFMVFDGTKNKIIKDEKRLETSNQNRLHRGERVTNLKREQLAKDLGEYVVDPRNYIYTRPDSKPKAQAQAQQDLIISFQGGSIPALYEEEEEVKEPARPEVEALFDPRKLGAMTNFQFNRVVQDKYARKELITKLLSDTDNPLFTQTELKDIDFMMQHCDRDIFQKLMSGEINANQLS